jgi:hypothetical protein
MSVIENMILAIAAWLDAHDVRITKVGGLYHWRIGRLGGSIYLKRSTRISRASRLVAASKAARAWLTEERDTAAKVEPVTPIERVPEDRIAFAMSMLRR